MKRKLALLLALATTTTLYGCGSSDTSNQVSTETSTEETTEEAVANSNESEDESTETTINLSSVQGSYVELFPEFAKDEYKDWWIECINAYETDEDTVESYYKMLTETYIGTLTGQDAVETYSADSFLFDCFFENDIDTITIEGNTISGLDVDENLGGEE